MWEGKFYLKANKNKEQVQTHQFMEKYSLFFAFALTSIFTSAPLK